MARHQVLRFLAQPGEGPTLWATIDGYPNWLVRAEIAVVDGAPCIADLRVHARNPSKKAGFQAAMPDWTPDDIPPAPPGGIPTRLLRAINAGGLLDLAQAQIRRARKYRPVLALPDLDHRLVAEPRRPGRKGYGIEHYLLWAQRYAEKIATGSRQPVAELAREYHEDAVWVRDTITDARRRHGLLTLSSGQGRAGGQLTLKALALMGDRSTKPKSPARPVKKGTG